MEVRSVLDARKLLEAYEQLPVVGEIEGEQRSGEYTVAIRWHETSRGKVPQNAVSVGDDLIARVSLGSEHMLVLLKVVEVLASSPFRSDAYVIGRVKTAPRYKVYAKVMPTMALRIGKGGVSVSAFATVLNPLTEVRRLEQVFVEAFLEAFKDKRMMIPGKMLGSDMEAILWLPHFGKGPDGIGEAYHIGVFGRTGSGKSALTKQILAHMGKYPELSAIVFDPQGEFARDVTGGGGSGTYPLNLSSFWNGKVDVLNVEDIRVESLKDIRLLIEAIGYSKLMRYMGISRGKTVDGAHTLALFWKDVVDAVVELKSGEKEEGKVLDDHKIFAQYVARGSDAGGGIGEGALAKEFKLGAMNVGSDLPVLLVLAVGFARYVYDSIEDFYSGDKNVNDKRKRIESLIGALKEGDLDDQEKKSAREYIERVAEFWNILMGSKEISESVEQVLKEHRLLVITMESRSREYSDDEIHYFYLAKLVEVLLEEGRKAFAEKRTLNLLVVLDEAHRFAPAGSIEDRFASELRTNLVRAVRETRKYGLGWLFVSQTLASLDKELVSQIRLFFVGYGLNHGSDRERLASMLSGYPGAIGVYMQFPDPFSAKFYGTSIFPFMAIGPASPLSATGFPIFFATYDATMFRDRNMDL